MKVVEIVLTTKQDKETEMEDAYNPHTEGKKKNPNAKVRRMHRKQNMRRVVETEKEVFIDGMSKLAERQHVVRERWEKVRNYVPFRQWVRQNKVSSLSPKAANIARSKK